MGKGHEIAKALASQITALRELPARFVFWLPRETRDEKLDIAIAWTGEETEPIDRAGNKKTHSIEVALRQKLKRKDDVEELAAALDVVQQIKDLFEDPDDDPTDTNRGALRTAKLAGAYWVGTEHEPLFDGEDLTTNSQFTAVLRLRFEDFN